MTQPDTETTVPTTQLPDRPEAPPTVTMTERELGALLGALQLQPAAHSPLAAIALRAPRITATQRDALVAGGWMTGQGQMTPLGTGALQAVARPSACVDVVAGTPSTLLTSSAYSAGGELGPDSLVFLIVDGTAEGTVTHFQPGHGPRTVSESLRDQLLVGPVTAPASLRVDLSPAGFVALLGTLDWRLSSLLAARLDREPDPAAILGARDVWEMIVEGRTAGDLTWGVTLFTLLAPFLPWDVDRSGLDAALAELDGARLTAPDADGRHAFLWKLQALADALYPIVSFGAVTGTRWDAVGTESRAVTIMVRGRAAMMMAQLGVDADGAPTVGVDVLDDVEAAEVFFQIAQTPEMLLPPVPATSAEPADLICAACGRSVPPDSSFCRHCGAPLAKGA